MGCEQQKGNYFDKALKIPFQSFEALLRDKAPQSAHCLGFVKIVYNKLFLDINLMMKPYVAHLLIIVCHK